MAIFGAISITELGAFLINSNGISSDLGLGIRGDPSLDLTLFDEPSLERFSFLPLSFFRLGIRFGLSPSRCLLGSSALCITPGELSLRGAANPGPLATLNRGRFSLTPLPADRDP